MVYRKVCHALRETINRKMVFIYSTKCETSKPERFLFSIRSRSLCRASDACGKRGRYMRERKSEKYSKMGGKVWQSERQSDVMCVTDAIAAKSG